MPKPAIAFEIDDTQTVEGNITAFTASLATVDAPLADILAATLPDLSYDIAIDQAALLDALFAATAPRDAPSPSEATES